MGISEEASNKNVDELISRIRSRLKLGGPDVNYEMLYAYIDDDLPNEESRKKTQQLIYSWQSWYDAYWQIRAELDVNFTESKAADSTRIILADTSWETEELYTALQCAALMVCFFCHKTSLRTAVGKTRKNFPDIGNKISIQAIEEHLKSGSPLTCADANLWLHVSVEGKFVYLRVGRSPVDPIEIFEVHFINKEKSVVIVRAENGLVRLTMDDFKQGKEEGADAIAIIV